MCSPCRERMSKLFSFCSTISDITQTSEKASHPLCGTNCEFHNYFTFFQSRSMFIIESNFGNSAKSLTSHLCLMTHPNLALWKLLLYIPLEILKQGIISIILTVIKSHHLTMMHQYFLKTAQMITYSQIQHHHLPQMIHQMTTMEMHPPHNNCIFTTRCTS